MPVVKPYLTGGPSFRATASWLAKHMSGTGVTAELGIETHIGPLLVAPEVRYTHWGGDGAYPSSYYAASSQNQVEFLVGVTTASRVSGTIRSTAAGWSKYLAVGVKGGWPFATAFIADSYARVTYPPIRCGDFSPSAMACSSYEAMVKIHRASRNYLVGSSVEVHLLHNVSIEGDALYGPLSLATPASRLLLPSIQTYASWSFPVVGKYRFGLPFANPYLEAGPTFRTASSSVSHYLT